MNLLAHRQQHITVAGASEVQSVSLRAGQRSTRQQQSAFTLAEAGNAFQPLSPGCNRNFCVADTQDLLLVLQATVVFSAQPFRELLIVAILAAVQKKEHMRVWHAFWLPI